MHKGTAIIWDLDGVVVDSVRSDFHLDFMQKDFTRFEAEIPTFDSFEWSVDMIRALRNKHHMVFITARNEAYREETSRWIRRHLKLKASQFSLYMRGMTDGRPDTQVKAEILPTVLQKYEVLVAFDDNADNAKLFSYFGIKSCHVL